MLFISIDFKCTSKAQRMEIFRKRYILRRIYKQKREEKNEIVSRYVLCTVTILDYNRYNCINIKFINYLNLLMIQSKVLLTILQLAFMRALGAFGKFVLEPFDGNGNLKLIMVMVIVPMFMNAIQVLNLYKYNR